MKRASVGLLLCLLCLGPLSERARGDLLEFRFAGTTTSYSDPQNLLGLDESRDFTGSFTYDPSTPDSLSHPDYGRYLSVLGVNSTIGTVTISGVDADGEIHVVNGSSAMDTLKFWATGFVSGDLTVASIEVNLLDDTQAALTNDMLPLTAADVAAFPGGYFIVKISAPSTVDVTGTLTFFTIVPEPGTWAFIGLAGMLSLRPATRRW